MTEESSLHLSSAAEMERKIHPKEDYDNEEDEGEPYPPLSPSSCSSLKLNMDGSTTTTTLSRSTSAVVRRDTTEEPSDANILSGDDSSQSSKGPITMDSKIGAEKVGMLMKKTKLFTACDGNNVEQPIVGMVSSSNSDNTSSDRKSSVISLGGSSSTSKRTRRTTGTLYGIEEGQPQQNQQQQRHHQKQRRHRSSMELRRMPENVLLKPANLDTTSVLSDDPDGWKKGGRGHDENDSIDNRDADFWRKTCLRPTFTLRTQMMLSFGTINVVTITLVVAICVALSVYAGDNVKTDTEEMVTVLTTTSHRLRSRYLSELLSEQLFLVEPVKLLYEATRDRFEGYPNPSDDSVPFVDLETGRNKYPIVGKPMPLEWDVNPTITGESLDEFLANRRKIFENRTVDVFNAAFMVQGVCDPKETDPTVPSYWPGCTDANNNITTGGVIAPTSIAESIYRKGSDLVPLMRSIFEGRDEIMDLGLYFANDGAGAYINYPQYGLDIYSYSSTGCDWLLSTHPYDPTRTIGSQEMISNCHPEGELVPIREYNPLERSWCRDQALNPEKVHVHCYENVLDSGNWIVSVGNAVYDRTTNEFVACTYVGIHMSQVDDILTNTRLSNNTEASLVLWGEDGFIVSSSKWSKGVSAYDTGIGLTKDTYDELYNLVDYDSVWDPKEARDAYDRFSSVNKEYCASAHPMPPIPEQYDPLYRPVLFVISSHYSPDLDEAVDDVSENVDARVYNINKFALICGLAGIATATIVIFVMARMLTAPLTQMNKVANEIVNNFGDSNKEAEIQKFDGAVSTNSWFTPKTELSEVVAEFNKMVAGFSGASEARSEKYKDSDMENHFPARRELWKIYSSRSDRLFKYNPTGELVSDSHEIKRGHEQVAETATSQSIDSIEYLHHGPNHITALSLQDNNVVSERDASDPDSSKKCSPLFLWIVALIVTPLIFITLLVSVGVTQTINSELSQSTEDIQTDFVDLQMRKLLVYASLRSTYISSLTAKSTDDMQVLARFSTWLLFGGLNRSDSFTEVTTGIEECKTYSGDFSQCEYLINNFLCDCEWEEKSFTDVCTNYNTSVRHSETIFWFAEKSQSSDGDRLSTDFPNTSASPETTEWWKNVTAVPGWRKGRNASGYDTTYDRIRVMSANPLFQPLFHYGLGSNGVRLNLGGYVAFEADGLVMGYGGCSSAFHVDSVIWNSTEENNAANMRPELCPLGKYGYDPRCRGWYHEGKTLAMSSTSMLHVTAPYRYANRVVVYGQSATTAIIDPFTGEYVGQVLMDFTSQNIYETVENFTYYTKGGFPILIAVQGNASDTIVGPGVSIDQEPVSIAEGVLPYDMNCTDDSECTERLNIFLKIVEEMKNGESAVTLFKRKKENGQLETMHIAYAPVSVPKITFINSSDYSRGVQRSDLLVYSFAIVEPEESVLIPFRAIEDTMKKQANLAIIVITAVILVASLLVVYFSHRLTKSFTEPMIYLLHLIRYINKHGVGQEPPQVRKVRASYEIVAFSMTLEALYKIVRSANSAFFAGEVEGAYLFLLDALRLFRRLDNKKAVGIASNNIGNTLFGIYCEMQSNDLDMMYGLTRDEVITQGIAHFHNAIHLGEKAYDEFYDLTGWSPQCLDFMQHLANRYFNRGMFLLHVKDDHKNPKEIEELGMRDLQIARDMDQEVVSYGEEIGWGSKGRVAKRFNVCLGRIRGYTSLQVLGYDHDWGVDDLIEETLDTLKSEYHRNRESSGLFADMTVAGRLQEWEGRLIRHMVLKGELETAARIAVRMIIEDEHVFVDSMMQAIDALVLYAADSSSFVTDEFRTEIIPMLQEYHDFIETFIGESRQVARDDLGAMSIAKSSGSIIQGKTGRRSPRSSGNQSATFRPSDSILPLDVSSRFVTMEDF